MGSLFKTVCPLNLTKNFHKIKLLDSSYEQKKFPLKVVEMLLSLSLFLPFSPPLSLSVSLSFPPLSLPPLSLPPLSLPPISFSLSLPLFKYYVKVIRFIRFPRTKKTIISLNTAENCVWLLLSFC
jgi:hypothetical protein